MTELACPGGGATTGPRLQMFGDDGEANRVVEKAFARWAHAIDLPEKLRTLHFAVEHVDRQITRGVGQLAVGDVQASFSRRHVDGGGVFLPLVPGSKTPRRLCGRWTSRC